MYYRIFTLRNLSLIQEVLDLSKCDLIQDWTLDKRALLPIMWINEGFCSPDIEALVFKNALGKYGCYNKIFYILGGSNHKHLLFTILEAGSPRSRCWQIWYMVRACFLVHRLCMVFCYILTWWRAERGTSYFMSLIRVLILFMKGALSWPHLILMTSQRLHLLILSH